MKNIHLLPTDNPSRIARDFDKLILNSRLLSPILYKTQNIYITSDEEIKEGDWFIQVNTSKRIKHHSKNGLFYKPQSFDKKIIITTDQKLIKDGVQAINDEFLEWFVKNPNCEKVEIVEGVRYEDEWIDNEDGGEIFQHQYCSYKIIIPKEEPKRTHYLDELPNIDKDRLVKMWEATIPRVEPKREIFLMNAHGVLDTREPKQETLEEAAKRLYPNRDDLHLKREFKNGAKWQQERMYSEEEVKEIISEVWLSCEDNEGETFTEVRKRILEQFKKK